MSHTFPKYIKYHSFVSDLRAFLRHYTIPDIFVNTFHTLYYIYLSVYCEIEHVDLASKLSV